MDWLGHLLTTAGALLTGLVGVVAAAILRWRQRAAHRLWRRGASAADNSADKLNQEELDHIKKIRHQAQNSGKRPNARA